MAVSEGAEKTVKAVRAFVGPFDEPVVAAGPEVEGRRRAGFPGPTSA